MLIKQIHFYRSLYVPYQDDCSAENVIISSGFFAICAPLSTGITIVEKDIFIPKCKRSKFLANTAKNCLLQKIPLK